VVIVFVAVVDKREIPEVDAKVRKHRRLSALELLPIEPKVVLRAH